MKKVVAMMLVLVLLAATLVACTKPAASQEQADTTQTQTEQTGDVKPGAGAKKLGIILSGTKDDYGFNLNFVQLGELVEKELGIEVVIKENVPTTSDSEGVMEELIAQGCTILFPSQFGFLEYSHNVALRHPEVAFYSLPITDYAGGNFSIIHGEVQDVWYLNGVLAAMYSTTDKIGFIGSLPIPDVIVAIDAFALGAQSIKPEIDITAVFTGSWADTGLQTTSVNQLIDSGCDVIAPFQDSIKTMMEICRSRGVHCFGCNSDAYELDPQTWLSACITDWSGYIPYLKQAIDGEYELVNISGGMELNLIKQATFGDTVSDEIVAKLGEVREQLINKEIAVFEGPIYAQDGSVMFEDGYRPTIEEINVIDQLVQGVKGSMN